MGASLSEPDILVLAYVAGLIVRLAIIFGAILSVTVGYLLFRIAATSTTTLEASGAIGKLHLTSTAPGIFFSLFGCVVLTVDLMHPPTLDIANVVHAESRPAQAVDATRNNGDTEQGHVSGALGVDLDYPRCVQATDFALEEIRSSAAYHHADSARRPIYDARLRSLELTLASCVDRVLGAGSYAQYKRTTRNMQTGAQNDPAAIDNFTRVSRLLSGQ